MQENKGNVYAWFAYSYLLLLEEGYWGELDVDLTYQDIHCVLFRALVLYPQVCEDKCDVDRSLCFTCLS